MDWYPVSIVLVAFGSLLTLRVTHSLLAPLSIALAFNLLTFLGATTSVQADPRHGILAFYVALGTACVAVGAFVASKSLSYGRRAELGTFRKLGVQSIFVSDWTFTLALLGFLTLSMVMVILLFVRGGIPLLSDEVFVAKVQAARQGGYLNVRFMRLFLPLLVIVLLVGYDRVRIGCKRTLLAFVIAFLLASFTLFGYRSYVLNYLVIPIAMLLSYRRVSTRILVSLGGLAAMAAVGITAVAYRETNPIALLGIISSRVTADLVSGGLGVVVNILVPQQGYMHGRGFWMDIPAALSRVGIGPSALENSAQYIVRVAQGDNPYGWQAAPTLVGEAFANFGVGGILLFPFLFGFVMELLDAATMRGTKDTFLFPLKIYIQHSLIIAYGSPFVFSLFDSMMSLAIFCFVLLGLYVFWGMPTGVVRFKKIRRPRVGALLRDGDSSGRWLASR